MGEKYFIQKGSFMYMLVKSENSNPDWANKPFEVIEKTKFDEVQKQLEISNQQLKLGELLNNDLQKEVDRLKKENTELRTRLECCVDISIVSRLNEELEEKQKLIDETLEVIRFYSVSGKYHYSEYWKNGELHFNPPSICFDYGETANEFLKKVENGKENRE